MGALLLLGLASAFLSGAFVSRGVAGSRLPDFAVMVAGAAALVGHFFVVLALPFHGAWGEIPVIASGALAFSGPMTLVFRHQKRARDNGLLFAARTAFLIFSFGLVLVTLIVRLGYAHKLGWECDGKIVQQDRSYNHRATLIVVECADGRISFEGVDESFWRQASPGMMLTKKRGSPTAFLDGKPIRMLEPVKFWHDPP
jgi:hypothetical protein